MDSTDKKDHCLCRSKKYHCKIQIFNLFLLNAILFILSKKKKKILKYFLHFRLCMYKLYIFVFVQQMPVILAGNEEQKKKYLGQMTEEIRMCVSLKKNSNFILCKNFHFFMFNIFENVQLCCFFFCIFSQILFS